MLRKARVRSAVLALLTLTCVVPVYAQDDHLADQLRDRERVIDADVRSLRHQQRAAEFGSRLYHALGRCIRALERERSEIRGLESAIRLDNQRLIERRRADYLRAHQDTLRRRQRLSRTRSRTLQFGSRQWHANRRASDAWHRQQRSDRAFGPDYRRSLEAQIRALKIRRSRLEFGSSQWHAVNRQISALQRALRSAR